MVIIRLILTILIFIIPILSYLTEGIMSWMGYDGKHCGEIEMANKIVREIIHARVLILEFTRRILKMNIFR